MSTQTSLEACMAEVYQTLRTERSMTEADFATLLGLDVETYQKLERAEIKISVPMMNEHAKALGLPLSKLMRAAEDVHIARRRV